MTDPILEYNIIILLIAIFLLGSCSASHLIENVSQDLKGSWSTSFFEDPETQTGPYTQVIVFSYDEEIADAAKPVKISKIYTDASKNSDQIGTYEIYANPLTNANYQGVIIFALEDEVLNINEEHYYFSFADTEEGQKILQLLNKLASTDANQYIKLVTEEPEEEPE